MGFEEITPNQKKLLVNVLKQIVQMTELQTIALCSRQGLNLAFFSEVADQNADTFSAIVASTAITGSVVTEKLQHGEPFELIIHGDRGYTILALTGNFILIGASRAHHSLGLVSRILRRYGEEIPKVFTPESIEETELTNLMSQLKKLE